MSDVDEEFAELDAAVSVDAEAWRPEPGDKLFGHVIAVDTAESEYGPYPLVFIMSTEGKEVAFHAFHTVAKRAIERNNPQPGDRIAVMYKSATEKVDGKNTYADYRVVVRPPRGREADGSDTF